MPRETQADIFIRTLTELWQDECQRKKARMRLQLRESVRRFVDEFQAGSGPGRHPSDLLARPLRTTQATLRQVRGG